MNIYLFLIVIPYLVYLLPFFNSLKNNNYFNFFLLFIFLFVSFRYYVGPDWYVSKSVFKNLISNDFIYLFYNREFVANLISFISHFLGLNMYGSYFIFACPIFISFYIFCRIYENKLANLIFALPFYLLFIPINSPRQSFAIGILLLTILLASRDKKMILFLLFLNLLAIFVHNSYIFIIPLSLFLIFYENLDKSLVINLPIKFIFIAVIVSSILSVVYFLPHIYFYFSVHYLEVKYFSPAYYYRLFYFVIIGIISLFLFDKYNFKEKILFFYFIFLLLLSSLLSLLSSTVADRIQFYIYVYSLFSFFNIIKLNNYIFTNCMIVFNLFYFYVWTLISSSFSLWFPYQNLLIKLL